MLKEDPVQKQAHYWLVRHQSGEMSAAERRAFDAWMETDTHHRDAYAHATALWGAMDEFGARQFPARDAARRFRRSPALPWLSSMVTAVLLAAVALGVVSLREWQGETASYRTAKGEQQTVTLSDGSMMVLNTDTQLRVVYSRGARTIHLERGQALFTVEKDVHRPFEVIAGNGRIVDLGTRFDVRLQEHGTEVAVVEGKVRVTTPRTGPIHIDAGEGMSWSPRGDFVSHHSIDPVVAIAWEQSRLHFDHTPLNEVMAELARYHPISYRFSDSALATLQVSGSFRVDDLNRLFATLEAALPIHVRIEGALIQLEPRAS